jgi:hypothetical protein
MHDSARLQDETAGSDAHLLVAYSDQELTFDNVKEFVFALVHVWGRPAEARRRRELDDRGAAFRSSEFASTRIRFAGGPSISPASASRTTTRDCCVFWRSTFSPA